MPIDEQPPGSQEPTSRHHDALEVCNYNDIKTDPIHWLWRGWLAKGKFQLLAGSPGTGKTTLILSMIATITSGMRWPDGTRCEPQYCLMWSGEDSPGDTIKPRLIRMGADLSKVIHITGFKKNGKVKFFNPSRDMAAVEELLVKSKNRVAFVCFDPIVAVSQGVDSHHNAETRNSLKPCGDLAEHLGCCVIGVHHLAKGSIGHPIDRVSGSLAYGAAPRVVLMAAKANEEQKDPFVIVKAKSNIWSDKGGFGYDIDAAELYDQPDVWGSRIVWGEELEGTGRQILGECELQVDKKEEGLNKQTTAEALILAWLEAGPMMANQVSAKAELSGISERTLKRARQKLGDKVEVFKNASLWMWRLKL